MLLGRTPRIDTHHRSSRALAELVKVRIGGVDQWLLIRSHDREHPILLFVHGGPGTSELALVRRTTQALEAHFTVVGWDQRGAGKSYAAIRDAQNMRVDRFVDDVLEVTRYLLRRFGQERLVLIGHSWGSVIGAMAVARAPRLYAAYVGIGQYSHAIESERLSYEWTLDQARRAHAAADVDTLTRIGPPPYRGDGWQRRFMTQRRLLGRYGGEYHGSRHGAFGVVLTSLLGSTEYTVRDRINFFRGILGSVRLVFPQLLEVNLFEAVPHLDVPVWFVLGRHDHEVPAELSARYFDALTAPAKRLVWFERSAHLPNTEEPERFNRLLIDEVLPVASAAARGAGSIG